MKDSRFKIPAILAVIAGALIIIAPLSFAGPCRDLLELKAGVLVPMKCYWTARIFLVIGGLIALTGILQFFAKKNETRHFLSIILVAQALALLIVPKSFIIGICGMGMAACQHMVKVESVLLILVLLAGLANLFQAYKEDSLAHEDNFKL